MQRWPSRTASGPGAVLAWLIAAINEPGLPVAPAQAALKLAASAEGAETASPSAQAPSAAKDNAECGFVLSMVLWSAPAPGPGSHLEGGSGHP